MRDVGSVVQDFTPKQSSCLSQILPSFPPTPPRLPLPSFQHIQLVVNTQAKIPARIERFSILLVIFVRAETLLSPAARLSTLHLTWRCTSSTWSWRWITKLPAHTHLPPQFLSLACHPPTTCHHCGYILSVNLSRNTHIFLLNVSPSGFGVFNVTYWIGNTILILIHTDKVNTKLRATPIYHLIEMTTNPPFREIRHI